MRIRSLLIPVIVLATALIAALPATSPGASGPITPRIINGTSVDQATYTRRWNFIVRLLDPSDPQAYSAGFCGGSLIASRLVLTAAHCVTDTSDTCTVSYMKPLALQVLANGSPVTPSDGSETRTAVTRITVHPDFDGCALENDVAIIRLASMPPGLAGTDWSTINIVDPVGAGDAEFGDEQWGDGNGQIVTGDPGNPDGPWIAGWGNTRTDPNPDHGIFHARLDQVAIPIKSDSVCRHNYAGTETTNPFHYETMICAGTLPSESPFPKDSCQGDSGGPLIVWAGAAGNPDDYTHYDALATTPANYRLAGLTSWGFDCAGKTYGIYTRLNAFRSWIGSKGTGSVGNLQDPTGVTAGSPTVKTMRVSWVAPVADDVPTGYHVYVQDGTAYRIGASVGSGAASATVTRLHGGRGYRFFVTSIDAAGHESYGSPIAVASTLVDTVRPTRPGRPVLSGRTSRRLGFRWTASKDNDAVMRYEIWMRPRTQSHYKRVAYSVSTRYVRPKLKAHTYYVVKVRAIDYSRRASLFSRARLLRTRM